MRAAVRRPHPLNIVVAGGTDAGKTTFLRALLAEVEPWERLVVIEDALELQLERDPERHPDVVELETREANVEGAGEITMRELARHALRMAPDRVIVGEVRGGEVLEMLLAMSQGNDGSLCTLHADSSAAALTKIATYALMARERMPDRGHEPAHRPVGRPRRPPRAAVRRHAASCRRSGRSRAPTAGWSAATRSSRPGPTVAPALAHAFTTRTWDRLVANGLDPAVVHEAVRREAVWT